MKVLHLLNSNSFSGAENVACQIIDMFKKENDVEMVYCSPDGPIKETLTERKIRFIPLKKLSVSELKRVMKKEKPNLIHAHDFRASMLSAIICGNTPVISHIHNNLPWLQHYGIYSFAFYATCKKYRSILSVSNSVFDEFVFGEKLRNKLSVIGNPVNVREIQSKITHTNNEIVYDLGFCGRFTPQKNPEGFIEIVNCLHKKIPNIKAAMVGTGEQFEEMKNLIKQTKLNNVITLYGFQKNPYDIMKSFNILCMPSRWEGFGLVAVEALALGVPVVCSNVGGLPEIVNDECGKVCKSENEMLEECFHLLTVKKDLIDKSNRSLERADQLDNTVKYKNTIFNIYKKSLNQ